MDQKSSERLVNGLLRLGQAEFNRPAVCAACGGVCCKRCGCECHPRNFEYDPQKMLDALRSGKYSVDMYWEDVNIFHAVTLDIVTLSLERIMSSKDCALYVRARNVERPIVDILHVSVGSPKFTAEGPCAMWDPKKGCPLSAEERPLFGRMASAVGDPQQCTCAFDRSMKVEFWKMENGKFQELLYQFSKEHLDVPWLRSHGMPYLHLI